MPKRSVQPPATDWLLEVPRGKPLVGPRAIAQFIWDDPERVRTVHRLPRAEFGLLYLSGELLGFEGWVNAALARLAGRRRPRKLEPIAEPEPAANPELESTAA
jgi:hypothetical protein